LQWMPMARESHNHQWRPEEPFNRRNRACGLNFWGMGGRGGGGQQKPTTTENEREHSFSGVVGLSAVARRNPQQACTRVFRGYGEGTAAAARKSPQRVRTLVFGGGGVVGGQRKPTTAENEHECSILGAVGAVGRGGRPRRPSLPKMLHSEVVDGGQ